MKAIAYYIIGALILSVGTAVGQNMLIPYPQLISVDTSAVFDLKGELSISSNAYPKEAQYLTEQIESRFGRKVQGRNKGAAIRFATIPADASFSQGYYTLKVDQNGVLISAPEAVGAFYGVQTLLQLLEEHRDKPQLPHLTITDYPRFGYRGAHLDVCRHFFTVEEVKNYLDYLAAYKINKFHWHLTEDQGWRIEIKSHPKLTEIGAYRKESQVGPYHAMTFDGKPYGGFYTQDDIRDVVSYATKLHIEVIPEIEMPGHALAALAAYPELSCTGGPFEVGTTWGVMDDIFCPKEETFAFLEDVIDEVVTLFPSEYIHIGGDEAPKTRWKSCAHCQALIEREGLADEAELQSYFIKRIEKYVNSKGKKIIGWDEILEGGLAPNATVMSWTGIEGGIHAAKAGHDAIMTPGSHLYFDHYQGDPRSEPLAFGGDTRLEKVYSYEPIPAELSDAEAKHILGLQANLWTEYIPNFKQVQYMLFPRLLALSEVAWGTAAPEKYKEFESRVIRNMDVLERQGIYYSKAIFQVDGIVRQADSHLHYELYCAGDSSHIRYTTDGTEPTVESAPYSNPLPITHSQTVKAAYFKDGKRMGGIFEQGFYVSQSTGKPIVLEHQPTGTYAAQGAFTLVNGVWGNKNFFGKDWLGISGKDVIATIDLQERTKISRVRFATLERVGSWIHYPREAKVYVSDDNSTFTKVKAIEGAAILQANGDILIEFAPRDARYVKVEIFNKGVIPEGMAGAGSGAWLFVDEIAID